MLPSGWPDELEELELEDELDDEEELLELLDEPPAPKTRNQLMFHPPVDVMTPTS
ncbi:hypothetical protein TDB9533_02423 [Thalassocella blandensis]|nr:hypothetical protein TDB9533_02423 [Thalassocella blandensis]